METLMRGSETAEPVNKLKKYDLVYAYHIVPPCLDSCSVGQACGCPTPRCTANPYPTPERSLRSLARELHVAGAAVGQNHHFDHY